LQQARSVVGELLGVQGVNL